MSGRCVEERGYIITQHIALHKTQHTIITNLSSALAMLPIARLDQNPLIIVYSAKKTILSVKEYSRVCTEITMREHNKKQIMCARGCETHTILVYRARTVVTETCDRETHASGAM